MAASFSIDKLVTWQNLSVQTSDDHIVLKASSCFSHFSGCWASFMFIVITLSWNAITCFLESNWVWDRFLLLLNPRLSKVFLTHTFTQGEGGKGVARLPLCKGRLKQGVAKGRSCFGGGGESRGCHQPCPHEIFKQTQNVSLIIFRLKYIWKNTYLILHLFPGQRREESEDEGEGKHHVILFRNCTWYLRSRGTVL